MPPCPTVALGPNHKPSNITAMYSTAIKATNDVGARADRSFLGRWEIPSVMSWEDGKAIVMS